MQKVLALYHASRLLAHHCKHALPASSNLCLRVEKCRA